MGMVGSLESIVALAPYQGGRSDDQRQTKGKSKKQSSVGSRFWAIKDTRLSKSGVAEKNNIKQLSAGFKGKQKNSQIRLECSLEIGMHLLINY